MGEAKDPNGNEVVELLSLLSSFNHIHFFLSHTKSIVWLSFLEQAGFLELSHPGDPWVGVILARTFGSISGERVLESAFFMPDDSQSDRVLRLMAFAVAPGMTQRAP